MTPLTPYLRQFQNLSTDRSQWDESTQLTTTPNLPNHLLTYAGRTILGPHDHDLWPFIASVQWHRQKILSPTLALPARFLSYP